MTLEPQLRSVIFTTAISPNGGLPPSLVVSRNKSNQVLSVLSVSTYFLCRYICPHNVETVLKRWDQKWGLVLPYHVSISGRYLLICENCLLYRWRSQSTCGWYLVILKIVSASDRLLQCAVCLYCICIIFELALKLHCLCNVFLQCICIGCAWYF